MYGLMYLQDREILTKKIVLNANFDSFAIVLVFSLVLFFFLLSLLLVVVSL